MSINSKEQRKKEFDKIKEMLSKQEETLKIKEKNFKCKEVVGENFFLTGENCISEINDRLDYSFANFDNKYNMNSIYEEIKQAESRCEDLLDDIDEVIKLGEDLIK